MAWEQISPLSPSWESIDWWRWWSVHLGRGGTDPCWSYLVVKWLRCLEGTKYSLAGWGLGVSFSYHLCLFVLLNTFSGLEEKKEQTFWLKQIPTEKKKVICTFLLTDLLFPQNQEKVEADSCSIYVACNYAVITLALWWCLVGSGGRAHRGATRSRGDCPCSDVVAARWGVKRAERGSRGLEQWSYRCFLRSAHSQAPPHLPNQKFQDWGPPAACASQAPGILRHAEAWGTLVAGNGAIWDPVTRFPIVASAGTNQLSLSVSWMEIIIPSTQAQIKEIMIRTNYVINWKLQIKCIWISHKH